MTCPYLREYVREKDNLKLGSLFTATKRRATICTVPSGYNPTSCTQVLDRKKEWFKGANYSPLARPRRQRGIISPSLLSQSFPNFPVRHRPPLHLIPTVTGHHHPRRSHTLAAHLYLALLLPLASPHPPLANLPALRCLPPAVTFPRSPRFR